MQYMLLIYVDEAQLEGRDEAEAQATTREYMTFTGSIRESGNFVDGARLEPSTMATSVRVRDGQTLVTDGPFAETKEQLGGFYQLDVPSLDEALAWAKRVPSGEYGSVEVRPIWPREEFMT